MKPQRSDGSPHPSVAADMIIREWKASAPPERADEYAVHFRTVVAADLRAIAGFLGADLLRRDTADQVEFTVLSRWESPDAVAAFASRDPDRAVVEPGAVAALTDFDTHVTHYRIIESIARPHS
jgi:heme-degrading monooxygenase HmoA